MSLNIRIAPFILFVIYSSKLLILGGNLQDASVLLVIGLLSVYFDYKVSDKKYKELYEKLENQQKQLEANIKDLNETRDRINSLKLGQHLKTAKF